MCVLAAWVCVCVRVSECSPPRTYINSLSSLFLSLDPLRTLQLGLPKHSKRTSCHRQPNCCVLFGKFVLDYNTLRGRKLVPAGLLLLPILCNGFSIHSHRIALSAFVFCIFVRCDDAFALRRYQLLLVRFVSTRTEHIVIVHIRSQQRRTQKGHPSSLSLNASMQRVRSQFEWKRKKQL